MSSKIVNPQLVPRTGKIVLCQGCFDLLHIGHIKHLTAAKQMGDILVVAITADAFVNKGPDRPIFNERLRMEQVAALGCVDYVVLSNAPTAVSILQAVKPDLYVKGSEYSNWEKDITGAIQEEQNEIERLGGHLVFTDELVFSSSQLINNYLGTLPKEASEFLSSRPLSAIEILEDLDQVKDLRILVVGETIFDRYTFVNVRNLAAKHSILSSQFLNQETHGGGALATANHLSQFCDSVDLLTCLPTEYPSVLQDATIIKVPVSSNRLITKERFLDEKGKQLFRVDYIDDSPYTEVEETLRNLLGSLRVGKYDLLLVNDFGHGMISNDLAKYISALPIYLALNVQTNSANKGFNLVTKYPRADYVSIDLPEARLALQDNHKEAQELGTTLLTKMQADIVSITHGKFGTHVITKDEYVSVPVLSEDTIDTTGAGDAYFAVTSPLAYTGSWPDTIGLVGNAAGSLATKVMGNREPISSLSLKKYLVTLTK